MLNAHNRETLLALIQQHDSQAIHQQLLLFSVADQKQAKLMLSRYLADRKVCSLAESISIQVELMQQNLNLYFKSFALACEAYRNEPDFWQQLDLLKPLGCLLKENKAFYRQTLLCTLLHQLKPEHSANRLFEVMQVTEPRIQLGYLLEADSLFACYQFIVLASKHDIAPAFLTQSAKKLLTNNRSQMTSYIREDVVNFMAHYFNGVAVRYPFRRVLDPAQFSYAERSFEAFQKVIIPAKRIML